MREDHHATTDATEVALRSFVHDALDLLRNHRTASGNAGVSVKGLYWRHHESVQALSSYIEAHRLVSDAPGVQHEAAGQPGERTADKVEDLASNVLAPLVLFCCDEAWHTDDKKLTAALADARLYLVEGMREAVHSTFLRGVATPSPVRLGAAVLRTSDTAEVESIKDVLMAWEGEHRTHRTVDGSVTTFEQREIVAVGALESTMRAFDRVSRAIVPFLRIHTEPATVAILRRTRTGRLWPIVSMSSGEFEHRAGFPNTAIDSAICARATTDLETLMAPPPALALALRRLEITSDYRNPDYILDLTIILEALFSDDDKQELTHKLAQRVANFVASDFPDRAAHFKTIKEGYSARSKISHGRELPPSLKGIDARVATIVRSALARYLTYVRKHAIKSRSDEAQIIRRLDEMCLGGAPLLEPGDAGQVTTQ